MLRFSLFCLFTLIESISIAQQKEEVFDQDLKIGTYQFNRDSVENPNPRFVEVIDIKKNHVFNYKVRMGSFIRFEIRGKWRLEGDSLILDQETKVEETITSISCENRKSYFFDIKGIDGFPLNYSLSINNGLKVIRDLNGPYTLDSSLNIQSLQVITTSGLYSKTFDLSTDSNCFEIRVSPKRYFNNEIWLIKDDKLQPKGFDRKLTSYYLYLENK